MKLTPRLVFSGQAQAALNHYSQVFKGEIKDLMRYSDVKNTDAYDMSKIDSEGMQWIMHSSFHFGSNIINVTDEYPDTVITSGNSVILDISIAEEKEVKRIFKELSEGGKIIAPLTSANWCPNFGMVTDRFGINWMIMQCG